MVENITFPSFFLYNFFLHSSVCPLYVPFVPIILYYEFPSEYLSVLNKDFSIILFCTEAERANVSRKYTDNFNELHPRNFTATECFPKISYAQISVQIAK